MVDTIKFSQMSNAGDLSPNQETAGLFGGDNVIFNNPFPLLSPGSTGDRPPVDPGMYYRLRFNTTLQSYEYYSPLQGWVVMIDIINIGIESVTGTIDQIDIDSTDPQNPILSLSATLNAPGTLTIQGTTAVSAIINDNTMATALATNIATALSIKTYVDSFASQLANYLLLSGGTMTGDIDMGLNFIHNLATPIADEDAATKAYVDDAIGSNAGGVSGNIQYNNAGAFGGDPNFNSDGSGNISIDGSLAIDNLLIDGNRIGATTGVVELADAQLFNALDANSKLINNLATCLVSTDAANKGYVDATAAGRYFVAPVRVSATANFSATYNNGASGIGATLTASVNGAATQDGVTLALNDRVLFPFQSSSFQNGIYIVTDLGSVGTPAVYTRATDYDEPTDIDPGDTVGVTQGTVYAGAFWMETAIVVTIGTDPITFILSVNPNVVTLNTNQTITGNKTFTGINQIGNFIFTANQMQHASDTDNYFEFDTDIQNFVTGNSSRMDITNSGVRLGGANARVTTILNDATLAANSATSLPTQQAVKGYVNSLAGTSGNFTKNLIIGGDFSLNPWQRGTSFPALATAVYCADRWRLNFNTSSVVTVSRSTDSPTVTQAGIFTTNSILVSVTTADPSIGTGDLFTILQAIEGFNFTRIAQRPFTLSFWVKASVTGTYCVSFSNSGGDRSYIAEYVVNASSTWEYKTITVSSSPASGTWDYTNGLGVSVQFALACGSTFQTTPNIWQTGNFRATANQVNALATIGNAFQIALVQLEPGDFATPFEIRTFQQELFLCQRYYSKSFDTSTAPVQNGGTANSIAYSAVLAAALRYTPIIRFPITMRTAPTATYYNPLALNANWRNVTGAADSGAAATLLSGPNFISILNPQAATDAVGNTLAVNYSLSSEL